MRLLHKRFSGVNVFFARIELNSHSPRRPSTVAPMRPPAKPEPASVHHVLDGLLRRIDSTNGSRGFEIWRIWANAVGSYIAQHSAPTRERNGVLTVEVDSHSLIQELQLMRDRLRHDLNARLGGEFVRDILFVPGTRPAPAPLPEARPNAAEMALTKTRRPPLPPSGNEEFDRTLKGIVDARARRATAARTQRPKAR